MSNSNTYVVCNNKGGVGKSILSKYVLPTVLYKKDMIINVYEIDNSNVDNNFKSDYIHYKNFKISEQNEAIFDVSFNEDEVDTLSVVDVGGGDDTLAVISVLPKNKVQNPKFIIPTNDDAEQFDNTKLTIDIIRKYFKDPDITLVFNKVNNLEDPKEQFVNFFGRKEWGYKPKFPEIEKSIRLTCMVPDTKMFVALKNQYRISLLDMYVLADDLTQNQHKYRQDWKITAKEKNDKQYYFDKLEKLNFAVDVCGYVDFIRKSFKDL